jgi:biotin synthase-like enzyme
VELATLLSIKTGGCPEDCAYCPQSVHHDTGLAAGKLMSTDEVRAAAQRARVAGTPLADAEPLDPLEFIRVIAAARICMPRAKVRLSAGRQQLGEAAQALAFLAGANSIFYGEKLLTTGNPDVQADRALLDKLGLRPAQG